MKEIDPRDAGSDLPEHILEQHRAIESLREELEAIDLYDERIAKTNDDELRRILTHLRDEEKEHAAMVIAWLAKHDATFKEQLDRFHHAGSTAEPSLGIGALSGGTDDG